MSEDLKVIETWVISVLEKIPSYVVELDVNSVLGVGYLREQLCKCRDYLNDISLNMQHAKRRLFYVNKQLLSCETQYRINLESLIATDDRVRKGTSYKDRVAICNQILHDQMIEIDELTASIRDINALIDVLKLKHRELDDVRSDIATSKQLLQTEVKLSGLGETPNSEDSKDILEKLLDVNTQYSKDHLNTNDESESELLPIKDNGIVFGFDDSNLETEIQTNVIKKESQKESQEKSQEEEKKESCTISSDNVDQSYLDILNDL
jgi:hypothetical protein